jgi:hypothetical protein
MVNQHERIIENLDAMATMVGYGPNRGNATIAYASSPITTGPRMYETCRKMGLTPDTLPKEIIQTEILTPNLADGEEFARKLRESGRYNAVICPATFFAKGWDQHDYMTLWETVISKFANAIHLNAPGWNLSNGCTEEFVIGLRYGKRLYNGLEEKELNPKEGLSLIDRAIQELAGKNFDVSKLQPLYQQAVVLTHANKKEGVRV